MRSLFPGHYKLGEADFQRLWDEAMIVVDTNALLNLYRYRTDAREDFLSVLEAVADRLWIPHQVALEFHRRRIAVIADEKKAIADAQRTINAAVSSVTLLFGSKARNPHSTEKIQQALAEIAATAENIRRELQAQSDNQLDVGDEDRTLGKLEVLLTDRIGPSPTQDDIDAVSVKGEARYEAKIPPGFEDRKKEEVYYHAGRSYQSKFGDLLIWQQIINHLKLNKKTSVIFVSDDKKEDWWQIVNGKTLGPLPELVDEITREGSVQLFHMYTSDQFLRFAAERGQQVRPESIVQVQETNAFQSSVEEEAEAERSGGTPAARRITAARDAIYRHVKTTYKAGKITEISDGFGDYLVTDSTEFLDIRVGYLHFGAWKGKSTIRRVTEAAKELIDATAAVFEWPHLFIVAPKSLTHVFVEAVSRLPSVLAQQIQIVVGHLERTNEDDIFDAFVPASATGD